MKHKNGLMKGIVLLLLLPLIATACVDSFQGAATGSMVGAGIGAIIGAATGHPGLGAAIGAAAGGLGGAAIGAQNQANRDRQLAIMYDKLPNEWKNPNGVFMRNNDTGRIYYMLGNDHLVWNDAEQKWYAED